MAAAQRPPAGPAPYALLTLARDDDADAIRAAVSAGADVNAGNAIGQTALHVARALLIARAAPPQRPHARALAHSARRIC